MFVSSPLGRDFKSWATSVAAEDGSFPAATDEVNWRSWAAQVAMLTASAPKPDHYANWREWALDWIAAA